MAANAGQGIIYAAILQVNGTVAGAVQLVTPATVTGTRTQTYQDATGTIALLSGTQTWTGTQDFTGATALVATQTAGDSSTKAASTAFVTSAISVSNPMTTFGDMLYENATPTPARLAGNTTTTKQYLSQTGNGTISAAPAWAQVAFADLSGSISTAQTSALTGDVTKAAGSSTTSLSASQSVAVTWSSIQTISNATASTTTSTGALVVTGGIGAGGQITSGGTFSAQKGGSEARLRIAGGSNELLQYGPTNASTTTTQLGQGALNSSLGSYIETLGTGVTNFYQGATAILTVSLSATGIASFSNTTAATSTTVASVTLAGGLGVKLAIYAGGLISSTGKIKAIVSKTTTYTVTANDETVEGNATTAAFTISLPAAPANGEFHSFIKTDSTGNLVTISGNGKNINGAATYTGLNVQYNKISVQYDGTAWFIVG